MRTRRRSPCTSAATCSRRSPRPSGASSPRSAALGSRRRSVVPRALTPEGVFLVDKPAGPSSFAVVARIRSRTGARTGHAGTLDPFASGLLLVLSGRATRIAPSFVGLDKRYLTDVDLTARTSTGDPEGEVVERLEAPDAAELERRLAGLPGGNQLPIPAPPAGEIGGGGGARPPPAGA